MSDLNSTLQTALGSAYRLDRELGGGGMSRVFVARDNALGRDVVVKVLSPELAASLSVERFARETRLAAALQEPHIVPVLSAGATADGLPYYIMPFVRGDSLRARLLAGPIALVDAIGILRNIAQALAYAHGHGIVHRDIKPENVLLTSGTAVVTDFGIAKAVSASSTVPGGSTLTSAGTSIGTPAYMAPEQAVGDTSTDHRADLYAWGVVAYEVLAGSHPFAQHTSAHALVAAHMSQTPEPLAGLRAELPAAIVDVVMQCLEKDPARRPTDAAELLAQLALATTPSASPAASRRNADAAPTHRTSRARFVAAGVALVAVAAVIVFMLQTRPGAVQTDDTDLRSIAVLPFTDLSSDGSTTRLGEGVAETLMNALAQVPGLMVSARASAFSLRDQGGDIRAVGRQLNVESVLTGSIQRAGDNLRIGARVVRVENDSILWSNVFDRPASDIFAVQDEVARAVTNALRPQLGSSSAPMRQLGGTQNTVAYDAYILGRYFWNQRTTDGMVRAAQAFERAVAADSNYAQAWSGLADTYSLSIPGEYNVPGESRDTLLARAERAARKAIALAPTLADGYVSLGEAMASQNRRDEAITAFERGVALNPSYATGHQWLSYSLADRGRWDEAIRAMEIAHELDPLAPVITISLAVAYDGAGRLSDAAPLYAQGLAQAPNQWYGWRARVGHDLARGDFEAALVALREAVKDTLHPTWESWRDLASGPADSATWANATERTLRAGAWDLGISLARWRDGNAAPIEPIAVSLRESPQFGRWAARALLGPVLMHDPRLAQVLRDWSAPNADSGARAR